MARGSKASYTNKQRRQAKHIEDSEKKSGRSARASARIAYATINKQDHGGKKSGSGRGKQSNHTSERRGGHNSHKSAA